MLPANVMSFMKKMVAPQEATTTAGPITPDDSGTTFRRWKQFGSELMTATGNVTKLGPTKVTPMDDMQPKEEETSIDAPKPKVELAKPPTTGDECRVCRKPIRQDEIFRTCCECRHKVCEDCASYSTTANSDDQSWRCSVCRRKISSRGQPVVTQESTDSLLEVPVLEAIRRRHSDVKLSGQGVGGGGDLGSGLAPPRSPEIRRHSDVSPASLKELEKAAGERRDELMLDKKLDRKSKSRTGSPERHDKTRGTSPQRTVRSPHHSTGDQEPEKKAIAADLELHLEPEGEEHRRRGRRASTAAIPTNVVAGSIRRKSIVTRQRSYDDEINGLGQTSHAEVGLPLPAQLPRRASAYDVYATPGAAGPNVMPSNLPRGSISNQGAREPDDRHTSRRPSFRYVKPPYEIGAPEEKIIGHEVPPGIAVPIAQPIVQPPILIPDEERRAKRRGSQLPDINAIRAFTAAGAAGPSVGVVKPGPTAVSRVATEDRDLPRQGSLVDGEGIKIVIHDVDSEHGPPRVNTKRRVKLRRDPVIDKGHRTRGFGMRVVGGKGGMDGRTFAYIVWTVPGGAAEKAGLQQGDKVLEWSGVSLVDRSFEEVAEIIERSEDIAEIVVEQGTDLIGDLLDDPGMAPQSGKQSANVGLLMETETDKTPSSPTRRKLPKTPEQIAKERQVTGRVQIQVSYENERKELIVSVFMADDLCAREDNGYGTLPEAYAKLVLVPSCGDQTTLKTTVAEPTQKPIWNATLFFSGVDGESLMDRAIEVTLWDYCPDGDNVFLGECTVDLQNALEDDRAVWYRLEDPRCMRSGKSPYCSPRGSFSTEVAQRLLRKTVEMRERSHSDDTQSDSGSPELGFLHPDHAWHAHSRRGSSQSEQLEVEPYELNKDYSISLPGSRRSSFQSQGGTDSKRGSMGEAEVSAIMHYNRDRRRSSFSRPPRDPEEILESLRSLKSGKGELTRTMTLTSDKRRGSRHGEPKDYKGMDFPERFDRSSDDTDEEDKRGQSMWNENGTDVKLGRGQVPPKSLKVIAAQNGDVKLGFCLSKGTLEVEVICARNIWPEDKDEPDTYVKTYLRDGEKWLHKRKTRVIRHSRNPEYRQTLKYVSCEALGRTVLVMLWEKKQGFESNRGLGGAEVDLELLPLTRLTVDWYPLFPIHTLGTQTADSP